MSFQIVKKNSNSFELSVDELEKILLDQDVKDREIVVVSIGGAFRKGKSFLLNFFLRYLRAQYVEKKVGDWMGGDDVEIGNDGFNWKGGSTGVTVGIHIWPQIFLHDQKDGRKIAVILMDTQGTFDTRTTMKECVTIFALSTLLSSVQIYNVMNNIQEDDLQHLQLFAEYGRMVANNEADSNDKPFQKLLYLVRDWNFPYECEYGQAGGEELLNKVFEAYDGQDEELSSLRSHLKDCFSDIECFLMPQPGLNVTKNPDFKGKLGDIETEFKDSLRALVPFLLAPENLTVKKINGQPIKASDVIEYLKKYFEVFNCGSLPEPKTIYEATLQVHNGSILNEAKDCYRSQMTRFTSSRIRNNPDDLTQEHEQASAGAIRILMERHLMGGKTALDRLQLLLSEWIRSELAGIMSLNEGKFSWAEITIGGASLAAISIIPIFISPVLGFFGIAALSTGAEITAATVVPAAAVTIFGFVRKFLQRIRSP